MSNELTTQWGYEGYGVSREQACAMCHFSSNCGGCCAKCAAQGKTCGNTSQSCSLPHRDYDGARWESWLYLINNYPHLAHLKKYLPKKK